MSTTATSETFEQEVIKSEGKVIVDFWAEWCGPCHMVSPVLDRIADEHDVKLVKVNIDEGGSRAATASRRSCSILFEGGEPQASAIGAMPKGSLERRSGWLAPRLSPPGSAASRGG
jgi:thioredoxin 1